MNRIQFAVMRYEQMIKTHKNAREFHNELKVRAKNDTGFLVKRRRASYKYPRTHIQKQGAK